MPSQSNQEIELELTYLASEIPTEVIDATPTEMLDVYVPEGAEHPCLRLRKKGNKYEITKKKPIEDGDASVQSEQTIPLESEEFEALAQSSLRRLQKMRYKVELAGRAAEVDVFAGGLTGLVVIDFEFNSREEKAGFRPPPCCLADVTQENFIAGGLLAGKTYQDIASELERYNYKPLEL